MASSRLSPIGIASRGITVKHALNQVDEGGARNLQGGGEFQDYMQGGLAVTSLDSTKVRTLNPRMVGQGLLGDALYLACVAYDLAEGDSN